MITIYTDGSCLTNPGNGGWAAIINDEKEIRKISGSEKNTTNNRMELLAPINALKDMKPGVEIKIYTDSQYVKNGITEWINTWLANNWKTSKKEDVKNKDLWIDLYNFCLLYTSPSPRDDGVSRMPSSACILLTTLSSINIVYLADLIP